MGQVQNSTANVLKIQLILELQPIEAWPQFQSKIKQVITCHSKIISVFASFKQDPEFHNNKTKCREYNKKKYLAYE